jgi:hypothetical protein
MFNGFLDTIYRYFASVHPWRMFVHLIWVFCLLTMLSLSYIITFHFDPVVNLWEQSKSFNHFRNELSTTIAMDSQVNAQLSTLLTATGAARIYVFRYHNGTPSYNGVPFMFHTQTHEVIRPGVTRVINLSQRLPTSINSQLNSEFTHKSCVIMNNLDKNPDGSMYWFWQSRGSYAMVRCGFYTANGDLLGFVGADYLDPITDSKLQIDVPTIQSGAKVIGKLFDR